MNPVELLAAEIESLVRADTDLSAAFPDVPGWLDYGPPLDGGPSPCVRLDGLTDLNDKLGRYTCFIKLWSTDTTSAFITLAEQFKAVLNTSTMMDPGGYLPRPEGGRSCAMWTVTFAA